jgi:glycosyltransferase involved in cell wall biosynthesis
MDRYIVILSGNHLCHNPRVLKEAVTCANAGYRVKVLGAWISPELKMRDIEMLGSLPFDFKPVIDATEDRLRWMSGRLCHKLASVAYRTTGVESEYQLGYTRTALSRAALREPADLFIAHSEPALAVASDLCRKGRAVGIDMEDWFSEDSAPGAEKQRPAGILRGLERRLLRAAAHSTCPSGAMSAALAAEFGCSPPAVVYNAFPWADRLCLDHGQKDRKDHSLPSIHWCSQTLGADRGLEDLLSALPLLSHNVEVHLRGKPSQGFASWLADRTPDAWRKRVVLHALVRPSELFSRIAEHDIGFAGERPISRSRDLTVTNKILYYLLGGLAVVASDTAGQREVAERAPDAVSLYPTGDVLALAGRLNALLASNERRQRAKAASLAAAERTFCWERQANVLLSAVSRALNPHERECCLI